MTIPMSRAEVPRDRWERPLVVPPEGGARVAYTRCTTFVDALDEKYKLGQWMQRMVGVGLSQRKDLLLAFSALAPELMKPTTEVSAEAKRKGDELCDKAREAAAASAPATTGTALHSLAEQRDRGETLGVIPLEAQLDLKAYEQATSIFTALHIEQFMVHDGYQIGGTPDRVVEYDGRVYIADLKTGSIEYSALKIAMQLAVYAHCDLYDVHADQRRVLERIDKQRAIVIHLPAGTGQCQLKWVDIDRAWQAVDVARQVREWRKTKHWLSDMTPDRPLFDMGAAQHASSAETSPPDSAVLADVVASARSTATLEALWRENRERWTPELTELARARRALLEGNAA